MFSKPKLQKMGGIINLYLSLTELYTVTKSYAA